MAHVTVEPALAELAGFQAVDPRVARDIGSTLFQHDSGVQLRLTQEGVSAVQNMPGFAETIGQVGTLIGERGVLEFVSCADREDHGLDAMRLANRSHPKGSLYTPAHMPDVVIKAYHGRDSNRNAGLQLRAMTWLHRTLARTPDNSPKSDVQLSAPAQYAMLTSADGQSRTTVMARAPGGGLHGLTWFGNEEFTDGQKATLRRELPTRVVATLRTGLGRGALLLNDVNQGNLDNIIVDGDPLAPVPQVSIIDQPHTPTRAAELRARALLTSLRI